MISHKLSPDGVLILLFHGVVERHEHGVRNYIRKHIDAQYFRDILADLKAKGPCLSMDEVIEHHCSGEPYPEHSFAITFDDGFENNYSVAVPILEELGLPATFYITTDFVARGTMSWTDQAEYALETMDGSVGEIIVPWLNDARFSLETTDDKISFMTEMRRYVFEDEMRDPHVLVSWLYDALGVERVQTTDDPLDKKLSWDQLREMAANSLFIIGGHTHTHPIMSGLDENSLSEEIDICLQLLQSKAGISTRHFAYPQGQANHYSQTVIDALKKRGIDCCPTAIDGINYTDTGLFDLRRYLVDGLNEGKMV